MSKQIKPFIPICFSFLSKSGKGFGLSKQASAFSFGEVLYTNHSSPRGLSNQASKRFVNSVLSGLIDAVLAVRLPGYYVLFTVRVFIHIVRPLVWCDKPQACYYNNTCSPSRILFARKPKNPV